jgi:hypothetical protein
MGAKLRVCVVLGIVAAAIALVAADSGSGVPAAKPIDGGTFRIAMYVNPGGIDTIDPALGVPPGKR